MFSKDKYLNQQGFFSSLNLRTCQAEQKGTLSLWSTLFVFLEHTFLPTATPFKIFFFLRVWWLIANSNFRYIHKREHAKVRERFWSWKYLFAEYLRNLLASIKLVAFAEIIPVTICGLNNTESKNNLSWKAPWTSSSSRPSAVGRVANSWASHKIRLRGHSFGDTEKVYMAIPEWWR